MKKFVFILVSLLVLTTLLSQSYSMISPSDIKSRIERSDNEEEGKGEIFKFLVKYFGNENIVINFLEDEKSLFIEMSDGKVTNITESVGEGTVEVNFKSAALLESLVNEEIGFKQTLKNKEITIKGLTFGNKIKVAILNIILRIGLALS